jgi:hypothetical protein
MEPNAVDWRGLLEAAVAAHPKGKAGVALRLGVSRAYVSRALSEGKSGFAQVPKTFVDRVLDRLYVVPECPAISQPRPRADCQQIGNGPAPTHNPVSMRVWRACQQCPHKPEGKSK